MVFFTGTILNNGGFSLLLYIHLHGLAGPFTACLFKCKQITVNREKLECRYHSWIARGKENCLRESETI